MRATHSGRSVGSCRGVHSPMNRRHAAHLPAQPPTHPPTRHTCTSSLPLLSPCSSFKLLLERNSRGEGTRNRSERSRGAGTEHDQIEAVGGGKSVLLAGRRRRRRGTIASQFPLTPWPPFNTHPTTAHSTHLTSAPCSATAASTAAIASGVGGPAAAGAAAAASALSPPCTEPGGR